MNKLLYILTVAATAVLLAACTGNDEPVPAPPAPSEVPEGMAGRMGLYINLGDDIGSRAPADGSYDPGSGYENYIDLDGAEPDLRLYLFADDCSFLSAIDEFTVVPLDEYTSSKRYFLQFDVPESLADEIDGKPFRMLIMANCRGKYPTEPGALGDLHLWWGAENYIDYPVCPAGTLARDEKIPFFGVSRFTAVTLDPTKAVMLPETLHLLRALAKIDIYDSPASTSPIVSAELVRFATECHPFPTSIIHQNQYVKGNYADDYVSDTSLNAAPAAEETDRTAPFGKIDADGRTAFRIYCPVYRNINTKGNPRPVAERSRIRLNFENGDSRIIEFRDHSLPETDLSSFFNINRNYWYKYEITLRFTTLDISVDVLPYGIVDLRPNFGLD